MVSNMWSTKMHIHSHPYSHAHMFTQIHTHTHTHTHPHTHTHTHTHKHPHPHTTRPVAWGSVVWMAAFWSCTRPRSWRRSSVCCSSTLVCSHLGGQRVASSYSEAASSEHEVNYTIRTFRTCKPLQHTRWKVRFCKMICTNWTFCTSSLLGAPLPQWWLELQCCCVLPYILHLMYCDNILMYCDTPT